MVQHSDRSWTLIGGLLALLFLPTLAVAEDAVTKKPAAPAPDWRTIFQVHYAQRVENFREQNQIFQNVVLVGDSITEGFNVARYFPGRRVLNRGIGADVIGNDLPKDDKRGILKRLDESIFNCSPCDVFLLIGINDLGDGHSPEVIEAGYREILHRVKAHSPTLRMHVQSVLPTRGNFAKHNANVNDVNRRLQKLAKEFGYDFIDLHSQMTDERGELKKEFTVEGLHLTDPAYKVWKAQIKRTLGW